MNDEHLRQIESRQIASLMKAHPSVTPIARPFEPHKSRISREVRRIAGSVGKDAIKPAKGRMNAPSPAAIRTRRPRVKEQAAALLRPPWSSGQVISKLPESQEPLGGRQVPRAPRAIANTNWRVGTALAPTGVMFDAEGTLTTVEFRARARRQPQRYLAVSLGFCGAKAAKTRLRVPASSQTAHAGAWVGS